MSNCEYMFVKLCNRTGVSQGDKLVLQLHLPPTIYFGLILPLVIFTSLLLLTFYMLIFALYNTKHMGSTPKNICLSSAKGARPLCPPLSSSWGGVLVKF
jgi:hypothetical protein